MGYFHPLFLNLGIFNSQQLIPIYNKKIADDWLRTKDLWYRKRT